MWSHRMTVNKTSNEEKSEKHGMEIHFDQGTTSLE